MFQAVFKEGHKQARYDAAEIALDADERIAKLEKALQNCVDFYSYAEFGPIGEARKLLAEILNNS